jgi:AcrR family transcriptional regulator
VNGVGTGTGTRTGTRREGDGRMDAPARTIPQSPRAEATRQRILDAAMAEFAARGLNGARVDGIAARAGANKRMLYAYFGNKEDLWAAVLGTAVTHRLHQERALRVDELPPAEAMAGLVRFHLRYTARHPEFAALLSQQNPRRTAWPARDEGVPASSPPLLDSVREVLRRGAEAGVFRRDVDPLQACVTISALGQVHLPGSGPEAAIEAREAHSVQVVLGWLRP